VFGLVLLGVMLFMPQGILPSLSDLLIRWTGSRGGRILAAEPATTEDTPSAR
jgi:hypothetical protein